MGSSRPAPRTLALSASAVSILFVALVAATPRSPFQPLLPADAQPSGPLRWLAGVVGLDRLGAGALATVGILAVAFAAIAFLLVLRAAWRGEVSVREPGAVIVPVELPDLARVDRLLHPSDRLVVRRLRDLGRRPRLTGWGGASSW